MMFLRISTAQADTLRGNYGNWHALDPIPLADSTDYILTDAVLAVPAFADALPTLQSLDDYPTWQANTVYSVGDIREYNAKLWRIVQAHTSQTGWEPPVVPALWTAAHLDGYIYDWVQPLGAHDAYPLGAQVTHNGALWESLIAANVWEPGTVGTESLWVQV